jgi:hypothetical protein
VSEDPEIRRAVRRTVGIAALKRIRRIVDADNALEADKRRWARRLSASPSRWPPRWFWPGC